MYFERISQMRARPLGLILDMDGVLWQDNTPIGNLPAIFEKIQKLGMHVVMATNNSTKTVTQYQERMAGFGVEVEPWQIVTSSDAVTELLIKRFPDKGDVFVVGETGVRQALAEKGFNLVGLDTVQKVDAVVVAIDREITYQKFKEATLFIRRGAPFYGTNGDLTFPTPEGLIPGAGSFLALIQAATGVKPIIGGKPAPYLLELSLERLGTPRDRTLVVGDRLETDIAGGQSAGLPSALVLSGVTTLEMGKSWKPEVDLITQNLTSLLE